MNHESIARSAGIAPREAAQLSPLALAYVGDAVYDLAVRTMLLDAHDANNAALHALSARRVCAAAQAAVARAIESTLTEEEHAVFMRARNAKPHTLPKHADAADYAQATALEAVLGYVYLRGGERLDALLSAVFEQLRSVEDAPKPRPYKG